MAKANTSSGFFPLMARDLQDPTLLRLNNALQGPYDKINPLFSPGTPALASSPTFATVKASAQTDIKAILGNEFVTKSVADQLYGAAAIRKALVYGTTTQPNQSGFTQSQPFPPTGGGSGGITYGTHGSRPPATNIVDGTLYEETDRSALYQSQVVSGSPTWVYVAGIMLNTLANRPSDLGSPDKGFLFYATDTFQIYLWNGTTWVFLFPDDWLPYSPTISGAGTLPSSDAAYVPNGRLVTLRVQFTGTILTTSTSVTISLPVSSSTDNQCFSAALNAGSGFLGASAVISGGNIVLSKYDGSTFTGSIEGRVQGVYEST